MEADSWSRLSAASKRHQSAVQPRFDLYLGYEEIDGAEEDSRAEFPCPFCSEDFDIVGLCCHIDDEHSVEAKNGVCPVCAARVGMDMVGHITVQHANFFKMQRRRRFRKGSSGSHSTLSLLRKDLRGGNLQSLFGGSSFTVAPLNAAPDPLLSSFILNFPVADSSKDVKPESLDDGNLINKTSEEKAGESVEPSLSEKDQVERGRRSHFVRELVLSTIFDDPI
ncbi:protein DEHYDRATION-INDUCED 19 homolog 2-like [Phoenix dactylifera]|uniref:Protein DEHYDRATION-INDUCED 19 homolog 2-like n=1 Tax=Phoenix dactylifera TaxID=42345 RepID=A0A8B9A6Z1_PHODC|nr:protein DEHYDRATION-INDUCED 19 homolog 2-like [Phoenix dactylifera]